MSFLRRSQPRKSKPYVLHPPYGEARSRLLSRRPAPEGSGARPYGSLFAVVIDVGLDDYLVSIFLLADGTISIYSTGGLHSTGLRGAPRVADAATAIFEEVEGALGGFSPVDDICAVPLPERGRSQILVRTYGGDVAATDELDQKAVPVATIAAMALLLTQLARTALVEGFDRIEPGEVRYEIAPEYRRIRSALLSWMPAAGQLAPHARVASVSVEIGERETETVTSVFVFGDGSTSVYRSDGTLMKGLTGTQGIAAAARALLDSIENALGAFGPAEPVSLPQPGRVQFVARARVDADGEWTELLAIAGREELVDPSHPLSASFAMVNEVLRIAG